MGASAAGLTAAAAAWLIIMQWLSSALGGYLAGRLRCKWAGIHDHEVFFRDTAHGFLAWALAAFISVGVAASVAAHVTKMNPVNIQASAGENRMHKDNASDPFAYYVDSLFRADHPLTDANIQNMRDESEHILMAGAAHGGVPEEDRLYLAQMVSTATGIAPSDAEKRVSDVLDREKADQAKLRQLADDARKAASAFAIYTALSMFIGAFISCVAAAVGGMFRDKGWHIPPAL